MKEKKAYKQNEPKKGCVREPSVGYILRTQPVMTDEPDDEFEKLWKEGMTIEECRIETKRIIREIAAKKYGKK